MKFLITLSLFIFGSLAQAANVTTGINVLSYAATNVTTSAYIQLVGATPYAISSITVCDNSGQLLKIATGSVGNEVDLFTNYISGCLFIPSIKIPSGTRLSIKAISASATTGFNSLVFLP